MPEKIITTGNPIIRHKYTADPTAIVYKDTVYIYTGHDEAPAGVENYVMNDWLCFSSADMVTWQEHPLPLRAKDFTWAKGDAYTSKVIYHNDTFYWYVAVTHANIPGKAIGVAIAKHLLVPFMMDVDQPLLPTTCCHLLKMKRPILIPVSLSMMMDGPIFFGEWRLLLCKGERKYD